MATVEISLEIRNRTSRGSEFLRGVVEAFALLHIISQAGSWTGRCTGQLLSASVLFLHRAWEAELCARLWTGREASAAAARHYTGACAVLAVLLSQMLQIIVQANTHYQHVPALQYVSILFPLDGRSFRICMNLHSFCLAQLSATFFVCFF